MPLYAEITQDGELVGHNLPPLEHPVEHSTPAPPPISSHDTFAFKLHEAEFEAKWCDAFGPQASSASIVRPRPQKSEAKGERATSKVVPQVFENPAYTGPEPDIDTLFDSIFHEDQETTSPKNDIASAAAQATARSEETRPNDAATASMPTELRPTSANDIETSFTSLPAILPVTQTEKKISRVKHLPIFRFVKKKNKKEKAQKQATKAAQKYNLAFVQPPSKESEEDSM